MFRCKKVVVADAAGNVISEELDVIVDSDVDVNDVKALFKADGKVKFKKPKLLKKDGE